MPLYEYRCEKCGHQFEQLVSRAARVACPKCRAATVEKLFSTFAVSTGGGGAGGSYAPEPGPCGACGAPERGMCGTDG
jgi:putative FmdB family regulatory protein